MFPVHLENHWCCGAINFDDKRLEFYDSLGQGQNATDFFEVMKKYIQMEYLFKKQKYFDFSGWKNYSPKVEKRIQI